MLSIATVAMGQSWEVALIFVFAMQRPNSNKCDVNLNHRYQCPTDQNTDTFLSGYQNFRVNEMEVFGFDL